MDEGALYVGKLEVVHHAAIVTLTGITAYYDNGCIITLCTCLHGRLVDGYLRKDSLTEHDVAAAASHTESALAGHIVTVLCVEISQTGIKCEPCTFKALADVADIGLVHVTRAGSACNRLVGAQTEECNITLGFHRQVAVVLEEYHTLGSG